MNNNTTILGFEHKGTGAFVSKSEAYAQYGAAAFSHQVDTLRPLYNPDEVTAAKNQLAALTPVPAVA